MNVIRYLIDFFHINGAGLQSVKYAKGQSYPANDETRSHVEAGHAEFLVVDVASADVSSDSDAASAANATATTDTDAPATAAPVAATTTE